MLRCGGMKNRMNGNQRQEEIDLMMSDLNNFISEDECYNKHKSYDCSEIDECHMEVNSRCNSAYARSIDFGGYDSEEEFWENL